MRFELVNAPINNLTKPGYVVGSGKRSLTEGEIGLVTSRIRDRQTNMSRTVSTNWPFEEVIVPLAYKLDLDGRSVLRLTRAALDALGPDRWYERSTCAGVFGDAITVGVKFLMKGPGATRQTTPPTMNFAYTHYKMDILEYMSIPEAAQFCRGLTAHAIFRVFTRKGEHGLVPPEPVKNAVLDLHFMVLLPTRASCGSTASGTRYPSTSTRCADVWDRLSIVG